MFEYPTVRPKVSVRGHEFVIAVPLEEIVAIAENCPVMPAKVTDAVAFGAYMAAWLERHITEVRDAVDYAAREVLADAAYMGAGLQMVTPPYEDYIDRMWASTDGALADPRAAEFWRVDPRYSGPCSPRDCIVAAICANREGERERALEWLRVGWPTEELARCHWEVTEMHDEALEYAYKTYGKNVA